MERFIKKSRQDRNDEILDYQKKGYCFIDKNEYSLIDRIQVNYYGNNMIFGIRVSSQEPRFICVKDGANIDLQLTDIYCILDSSLKAGIPIAFDLKQQLYSSERKSSFIYKGDSYQFTKPIQVDDLIILKIPSSNIEIQYSQLIVLLALLQSKSSYFFSRKSNDNKKYMNGIYRLLICLLSLNSDHILLKKRGWIWNEVLNRFELRKDLADDEFIKLKYYLTQAEMETIMNL